MARLDDPRINDLGTAWIVASALLCLFSVGLGVIWASFGVLATQLPDTNTGEPMPGWFGLIWGSMGLMVALLGTGYALAGVVAGVGLRRGAGWARFVILLLSFTQLVNFPIGTLLGGFSIYILLPRRRE